MSHIAIQIEKLSKQYTIEAVKSRHDTLCDQLGHGLRSLFRRRSQPTPRKNSIWALKDVSCEIKQGEVVGIIGRNGAGKSTLLKVLSCITEPTEGRAEIYGRVGSLLEVGTGFHPELTGRENIYLNGAILGMHKTEIQSKFDDIVDFAEVAKFIDTPVKRYSSGMYLRLAFAVAAHLEPEILLVDEVLAVGDAVFQRKCLGKMREVAKEGRTVVFISHNLAAIASLCNRAIWLDNGRVRARAGAEEIIAQYLASGVQQVGEVIFPDDLQEAPGSDYIRLRALRIRNVDGQASSLLDIRLPFTIEIEYQLLRHVTDLRVGLSLTGYDGTVILSSVDTGSSGDPIERFPGIYRSCCPIPGDFLHPGQYYVSVGSDIPLNRTHFALERALAFQIEQTDGFVRDGRSALVHIPFPWHIDKLD